MNLLFLFFPIYRAPDEPPPGGGEPPPAPQMPEGLPETFWDAEAKQVKLPELIKSYGEAAAVKTQHDERVAALPQDAAGYTVELNLPDDFQVPEGMELKIDENDTRIGPLRDFALKHQLPQDALNELVLLDAKHRVAEFTKAGEEIAAEMQKLGQNGPQRVEAMEKFLQANVPDEYQAMRPFISDAAAFAGLEKLIAKAVEQKIPGHEPPPQPKPAPQTPEQRWYPEMQQQKAS